MSIPTLTRTWCKKCHILLATTYIFILNAIVLAVSAFMDLIRRKSPPMELPITTPTLRTSGTRGADTVLDYRAMCRLNAGFARASRIARNRLAIYGENSLFEANTICEENAPDPPVPGSWAEQIRETYMSSSNSTYDNTTITASSDSLDSRSVYSTPPPSIVLNTPIITVTDPSGHDLGSESDPDDDDGSDSSDYKTCDGDEYQSQSAIPTLDDNYEEDDGSSGTSKIPLGNLARRRGFPGLPIIASFPPSHALLSPLSIFQPSGSRRSLDPTSHETSSSTVTDTDSSLSFSCSTPCYDEDPFSMHGDSFYSTSPSPSDVDIADLAIYTVSDSEESDADPSTHRKKDVKPLNDLVSWRKSRLSTTNIYDISSYVPDEEAGAMLDELTEVKIHSTSFPRSYRSSQLSAHIAASDTPLSRESLEAEQLESTLSVNNPNADVHDSPSSPHIPDKSSRRITMLTADGNLSRVVDLRSQNEESDSDYLWRFSFPYYPAPKISRAWSPTLGPFSELSSSGPETVSVNPADSVTVNSVLGAPVADAVSQTYNDHSRALDLSSNDCGILGRTDAPMAPNFNSPSGSLTAPLDIPPRTILSGRSRRTSGRTEVAFFDRGRAVQAWVSMVSSSLDTPANQGHSAAPRSIENSAFNPKSVPYSHLESNLHLVHEQDKVKQAEIQSSNDPPPIASCRPKSLSSLSARAQAIALERHRATVIYSCRHRTSNSCDRLPALRPLMLPIRLALRDSQGRDGNPAHNDSLSDMRGEPSSIKLDRDNASSSDIPSEESHNHLHKTSQGSLDELLHALKLDSASSTMSDSAAPHHSFAQVTNTDAEAPNIHGGPSETGISWGIAF